jgi:murein DD-endopeptidase MepM/ murein hydrolase activator NlpD
VRRQQPVPPTGRTYRGRRRLPKLPSKRYFAVISTAVMAAGVVALSSEVVLPDTLTNPGGGPVALADRIAAADDAARDRNYGPAITIDADAADVWLLPLRSRYTITTSFEMRWGSMHFGVDLAAPGGTPIHATHAGTVLIADWYGGYGLCVQLDNGDGITAIYGHASALNVVRGQQVKAGDVIAWVGTTGFSTGDHLHYEILVNGGQYDPIRFMRERGVDLERRTEEATGGVPVA